MDFFIPMLGVGLATSFHCVSMCGALVVTYAVKDGGTGTWRDRLTPHLAYQIAKITSYVMVGLVLGVIGSAFDLAGLRPWVMLFAGLFMLMLGLNMTGRFPFLRRLTLKPPKALVTALARNRKKAMEESRAGRVSIATPVTMGLLTGLMPCGPLQAAQLSAAGAGSAFAGAASMLGFGLGTAPLMLAFGVGSGFLGTTFKRRMNIVAAIVIMVLGLVYLNRGSMMLGSPVTFQSLKQVVAGAGSAEETVYREDADGVAVVDLVIENTTFVPDVVRVPADRPVRLIVDRREDNACSDEIWLPQLGVRQRLEPFATTTVELPATGEGTYTLTCGMGMMSGRLVVGSGPAGIAGSTVLGVALGLVLLSIAGYAFLRRGSNKSSDASCPAPAAAAESGAKTILGFTPQEVMVVLGAIGAAVVAGVVLAGTLN